jgi:hypothetical protein
LCGRSADGQIVPKIERPLAADVAPGPAQEIEAWLDTLPQRQNQMF